ncbi:MAG: hypothetical protein QW057_05565 [Candidatus Bathyarchaeia archaeon]
MVAARRTVRVESVQAEKSRRERRPSGVEMNALAEKALRRSGVHIVVDVLPQMKAALGELQGEAAAAALFHLSKEGMKAWCTKMGEELGLPGSPASIRLLEQVDARNHWGRSRLLNVGPPPAPREVIAEGRLEPDFVSLLDGAASRFMRGLVAGLQALSSALRRTQAERSRRAAEEAYCRFEEKWQL